jgi:hypothetical protein
MTRRIRGLLGTIIIIALLVAYPLAIAGLLGETLATFPGWLSILAFAGLGILWFVPAAIVIRWMSRAD